MSLIGVFIKLSNQPTSSSSNCHIFSPTLNNNWHSRSFEEILLFLERRTISRQSTCSLLKKNSWMKAEETIFQIDAFLQMLPIFNLKNKRFLRNKLPFDCMLFHLKVKVQSSKSSSIHSFLGQTDIQYSLPGYRLTAVVFP